MWTNQDQFIHVPPEVAHCPICKAPIVVAHLDPNPVRYTADDVHLLCTAEPNLPKTEPIEYLNFVRSHWNIDSWQPVRRLVAVWLNNLVKAEPHPTRSHPPSKQEKQTMSDLSRLIETAKTLARTMHAEGVTRHTLYLDENQVDQNHVLKLTVLLEITPRQETQHPYGAIETKFLFQPINPKGLLNDTET